MDGCDMCYGGYDYFVIWINFKVKIGEVKCSYIGRDCDICCVVFDKVCEVFFEVMILWIMC